MYHKQMKNYSNAASTSGSKLTQVAMLLENCGHLLKKAAVAIVEKNYEERYILTDKVMIILSAIQDVLATDRSFMARDLNTYFQNSITLLIQINAEEDLDLCNLLRDRLIEMAQIWRDADRTLIDQNPASSLDENKSDSLEISA